MHIAVSLSDMNCAILKRFMHQMTKEVFITTSLQAQLLQKTTQVLRY